jgi:hypothetical protein
MEYKIKCGRCFEIFGLNGGDKIEDYLCKYLLNYKNYSKDPITIVRCNNIVCKKCKICSSCKDQTEKFHKLLD